MTKTVKNKRAFTLIELLVVVLIIGILAAVAVPQYQKAVIKARFAEAMVNLRAIGQADTACRLATGKGVCTIDELDVDVAGSFDSAQTDIWCYDNDETNHVYSTDYFEYCASQSANGSAQVQYVKEDVCLCYLDSGEIVLSQGNGCVATAPSFDYAKLLNVREGECSCC
ncbi:MAG: type II secretion system protein [Elusimicrobiaceae bacterium]|nr:type II secretion system protein [Elusimicrobiaceae bacterium]